MVMGYSKYMHGKEPGEREINSHAVIFVA